MKLSILLFISLSLIFLPVHAKNVSNPCEAAFLAEDYYTYLETSEPVIVRPVPAGSDAVRSLKDLENIKKVALQKEFDREAKIQRGHDRWQKKGFKLHEEKIAPAENYHDILNEGTVRPVALAQDNPNQRSVPFDLVDFKVGDKVTVVTPDGDNLIQTEFTLNKISRSDDGLIYFEPTKDSRVTVRRSNGRIISSKISENNNRILESDVNLMWREGKVLDLSGDHGQYAIKTIEKFDIKTFAAASALEQRKIVAFLDTKLAHGEKLSENEFLLMSQHFLGKGNRPLVQTKIEQLKIAFAEKTPQRQFQKIKEVYQNSSDARLMRDLDDLLIRIKPNHHEGLTHSTVKGIKPVVIGPFATTPEMGVKVRKKLSKRPLQHEEHYEAIRISATPENNALITRELLKLARTKVHGELDAKNIQIQKYNDCYLHALYHTPSNKPLRDVMTYEAFLERADNYLQKHLKEDLAPVWSVSGKTFEEYIKNWQLTIKMDGLTHHQAKNLMQKLGGEHEIYYEPNFTSLSDKVLYQKLANNLDLGHAIVGKFLIDGDYQSHAISIPVIGIDKVGNYFAVIRDSAASGLYKMSFFELRKFLFDIDYLKPVNLKKVLKFAKEEKVNDDFLKEISK